MQEHERSRAELTSTRGVWLRKVQLETRGERGTFQISLMSSGFLFYSVIFSKSIEKHCWKQSQHCIRLLRFWWTSLPPQSRKDDVTAQGLFLTSLSIFILELQSHRWSFSHNSKYLQFSHFQNKHNYHLDFSQYVAITISLDIKALKLLFLQLTTSKTHSVFRLYAESHPETLWSWTSETNRKCLQWFVMNCAITAVVAKHFQKHLKPANFRENAETLTSGKDLLTISNSSFLEQNSTFNSLCVLRSV